MKGVAVGRFDISCVAADGLLTRSSERRTGSRGRLERDAARYRRVCSRSVSGWVACRVYSQ
jgi:hypothetical protein